MLQSLIKDYIAKRAEADQIEIERREMEDKIMNHPDFDKSYIVDGFEVKKAIRIAKTLKPDATIPSEYKSETFDLNGMIKKEPSTRSRIQKGLMTEYPEYVAEVTDTEKLKEDRPDLFTEKATPVLSLCKAKKDTE